MKTRLLAAVMAVALALSLCACGSAPASTQGSSTSGQPDVTAPKSEVLDGEWFQVENSSDQVSHAAVVSGNKIEVYWFFHEKDLIVPYWTGTLTESGINEWNSENTAGWVYTDLTCEDAEKDFYFVNGQLLYEAATNDSKIAVQLERNDWGYEEYIKLYEGIDEAELNAAFNEDYKGSASTPIEDEKSVSGGATISQNNALEQAQSYIRHSAFSYNDLIGQLEYHGYSTEDATWAADNCGADWMAEALESAESYIRHSGFSYAGLIDQLEYSEFTAEQAKYGADNCGADWMAEAVECAASYLRHSSFSRAELIDQLLYEGFTQEQAEYGAAQNGY